MGRRRSGFTLDSATDSLPLANPPEPRTTAQLRRLAADVLAVSTNPLDGAHALDLLDTSYATPFAAAARARNIVSLTESPGRGLISSLPRSCST